MGLLNQPRLARTAKQGLMSPLEIQMDTMINDPLRPNLSSRLTQQDLINKGLNLAGFAPVGMITKAPKPFKVAHGTNQDFDVFNPANRRTAEHIYTVPESAKQDASHYGKNVLEFEASPKKLIDFSDYNQLDKATVARMKKAAKDAGITDKYYSFDDFLDTVMNGQMYQQFGNQRTQNAFLNELFGTGFDAVKMPDAGFGGLLSKSYVFENPELLKRIK